MTGSLLYLVRTLATPSASTAARALAASKKMGSKAASSSTRVSTGTSRGTVHQQRGLFAKLELDAQLASNILRSDSV